MKSWLPGERDFSSDLKNWLSENCRSYFENDSILSTGWRAGTFITSYKVYTYSGAMKRGQSRAARQKYRRFLNKSVIRAPIFIARLPTWLPVAVLYLFGRLCNFRNMPGARYIVLLGLVYSFHRREQINCDACEMVPRMRPFSTLWVASPIFFISCLQAGDRLPLWCQPIG